MGMVYADIGSLSLCSNYGLSSSSHQDCHVSKVGTSWSLPFMRECVARNFEEHPNSGSDVVEGNKGSDSGTDGGGENSERIIVINHNDNDDANFNEEENPNDQNCTLSGGKEGHSKLCARGHWRPAEDSKLKELVALYGPQNWNLIAEKLEGRSGVCV